MSDTTPTIRLNKGGGARLLRGHPWGFSNEIVMTAEAKALPPGSVVTVETPGGDAVGSAHMNPHSLIALRMLDRDPTVAIDAGWIAGRLATALAWRERMFDTPYYRVVHAEADGLPGLIVDRYGDVVVIQANSAGMDRMVPMVAEAVRQVLSPAAVVLRNDSSVRKLEGLGEEVRLVEGTVPDPVLVAEGGALFPLDPMGGQKTGWFYDHRDNRAFVARLAGGARVLDLYAHTGGFGIQAAVAGAASVDLIDRAGPALAQAAQAAELSGVADRVTTRKADAFAALEHLVKTGEQYDIVVCDPPAFARSKKDVGPAAKAYRKLARMTAQITAPGGVLLLASCSHHMDPVSFAQQNARGLGDAERQGRLLRSAGAGPDHPVHAHLPESAYLKAIVFALD
ncbi:class I SAM-dependent rRNA methyltransferase [Thalassobaculum litoreum]|uniref:23S rRNA (Cytosine1962-C5)-methyltransferase n=1 Tax=Thalassobaculum litoreum DSM 18839 TaxID=1123362 RepID=A0A8G2BK92_9PROT|nr:class I SAM-dependent rRNA methyltransferase [Thalassobaculum litoreum]SDF95392.1 23S rRNA (cytosine1962-C5)-methyltransferase [Thalassobaculum litoreum DSM 18839]